MYNEYVYDLFMFQDGTKWAYINGQICFDTNASVSFLGFKNIKCFQVAQKYKTQ